MKNVQAIERAIQLVTVSFAGKIRTGPTSIPASTHSLRVGLSLITYGYSLETVIGGFCHDVVEDTEVTLEMVERLFNPRVRQLVDACSVDPKLEEQAGEQDLNTRVVALAAAGDIEPLRIKCADCSDNLKTNKDLKKEFQVPSYESGCYRLAAAQRFFPNDVLTHDLAIIIEREKNRIFGS